MILWRWCGSTQLRHPKGRCGLRLGSRLHFERILGWGRRGRIKSEGRSGRRCRRKAKWRSSCRWSGLCRQLMEDALHGQINTSLHVSLRKCRAESLLTGIDNVSEFQDDTACGQLRLDEAHRKGCGYIVRHFEGVKTELVGLHTQKNFLQAQLDLADFSNRWRWCRGWQNRLIREKRWCTQRGGRSGELSGCLGCWSWNLKRLRRGRSVQHRLKRTRACGDLREWRCRRKLHLEW